MNDKMSIFEVACKVGWEGSIPAAFIGYGLQPDDIADPALSNLVRSYQAAYPKDLEAEIMDILDNAEVEGDTE